jgi:pimeloyl-ACP methyl ester carboxylesterase
VGAPARRVITIHGINHDPQWPVMVRGVLEPHFEIQHVSYAEYQRIRGVIAFLFDWRIGCLVCLVGLVAVALGIGDLFLSITARLLVVASVAIVAGCLAAGRRRRRVGDAICQRSVAPALPALSCRRPHIIAHSFGTCIVGYGFVKYPALSCGQLIFVGSILPQSLVWRRLLSQESRFEHLRNEVGVADCWVRMINWFGILTRDLGSSGQGGFRGPPKLIHHQLESDRCRHCSPPEARAPVHNVRLREFAHSSAFQIPHHAMNLWLPTLWGLDPAEYLDFREVCFDIRDFFEAERYEDMNSANKRLCEKQWSWLVADNGEALTLPQWFQANLARYRFGSSFSSLSPAEQAEILQLSKAAGFQVSAALVDAVEIVDTKLHDRASVAFSRVVRLNPQIAMGAAFEVLKKKMQ